MILCENCLDPVDDKTSSRFPVGHQHGSQRDPYHTTITLCAPCQDTLGGAVNHEGSVDLAAFHARWVASRTVER